MELVKIYFDDDGEKIDTPVWHLTSRYGDAQRTVCGGEAVGPGESAVVYDTKVTGKITCSRCIEIVKWFKSIKL